MDSNHALVYGLIAAGYIRTERIKQAFLASDRAFFVPKEAENAAYSDRPLPIGYEQTISAPSIVAFMLEQLDIRDGAKVLELGAGSGYNLALLSILLVQKERYFHLISYRK